MPVTPSGIVYERWSPRGRLPVLFIHAGIADRRMWDPQWNALADTWDVTRSTCAASVTPTRRQPARCRVSRTSSQRWTTRGWIASI